MRGNTHPMTLPRTPARAAQPRLHAGRAVLPVERRVLPVERAALIVAWTPFVLVLAHMVVFDILPLALAAATLGLGMVAEGGCLLRRRLQARMNAADPHPA